MCPEATRPQMLLSTLALTAPKNLVEQILNTNKLQIPDNHRTLKALEQEKHNKKRLRT
jgi:hypothetical protein